MRFTGIFDREAATEREWLLANGVGGYASATLCGMLTRRYHGLLVAALHPPGGRTLLVAKLDEVVSFGEKSYPLATNEYPGTDYPAGYHYLREFELNDDTVVMRFEAAGAKLEKEITVCYEENTTKIRYRNTGAIPYELSLTPLVNARDFHGETQAHSIDFSVHDGTWMRGAFVHVVPGWMPDGYWLYANHGSWETDTTWYYNMRYLWEGRRGLHDTDNHFSPGRFTVTLDAGKEVEVILSTAPPPVKTPEIVISRPSLDVPTGEPEEIQQLFHTAQSFLVRRLSVGEAALTAGRTVIAGYHWFGDWGRDTMIALPGLCLTTGQYAPAAEILRTFAAARRRGLLPNLFLDSGEGEAYNTVDASLWFFHAVSEYYRATGDAALVADLRPALEEIIAAYRDGTDYGISMADDGLIVADAPGWQLTWMDAKVGDWVVTPRAGKPVEINALWYNALRVMDDFAHAFGWPDDYGTPAARVQTSFEAFWNPDHACLYDVLGASPDNRMRPNQIFAVSLPHSPLSSDRARAVVDAVERDLLTPHGLRTLAPYEPEYRAIYTGNVWDRDGAYHQGTVWGWLMGPFVDAYLRVHGDTAQAKTTCRTLLQPLLDHVRDAGVGSISEIFDADSPHAPKGTISQAWSVAEVLRVWMKCK